MWGTLPPVCLLKVELKSRSRVTTGGRGMRKWQCVSQGTLPRCELILHRELKTARKEKKKVEQR